MRGLVIYHANCVDGFTAAWVAWRALGDDAEYLPAQYGDAPPDVTGRDVWILDFSYPRDVLLQMRQSARLFFVLDHHETSRDALGDLDFCTFDMERSGAHLAWDHFCPTEPVPLLVQYVEDRDLWRWKLDSSKTVNAAIASHLRFFDVWTSLFHQLSTNLKQVIVDGLGIVCYQARLVDAICANKREVDLAGHRVWAACTPVLQSEVGERLAEGRPFGVAWFVNAQGQVVVSLRSHPPMGIDVSEIARIHGGGGHAAAAGFTMPGRAAAMFTVPASPSQVSVSCF